MQMQRHEKDYKFKHSLPQNQEPILNEILHGY